MIDSYTNNKVINSSKIYVVNKWWGEKDSNLRSLATTELQSVPFGHSGIPPLLFKFESLSDFAKRLFTEWRIAESNR